MNLMLKRDARFNPYVSGANVAVLLVSDRERVAHLKELFSQQYRECGPEEGIAPVGVNTWAVWDDAESEVRFYEVATP